MKPTSQSKKATLLKTKKLIVSNATPKDIALIKADAKHFGITPVENVTGDNRFKTLVAKREGKILGFIEIILHHDDGYAEITKLGVHESQRKREVGKVLFGRASAIIARNTGMKIAILHAKQSSVPFYLQTHFVRVPGSNQFTWEVKKNSRIRRRK